MTAALLRQVGEAAASQAAWLTRFGETSQDHQDFFASPIGRAAKRLYYQHPRLGIVAVAPMIFCEAFAPWTRSWFHPRMRLPIADAHYAMGFALLFRATGRQEYYERAVHFLEVLLETRCPGYERHGWGYPFNWQTRGGVMPAGTPLITTTPYCYEAFEYVYRIDGKERWRKVLYSIAQHVLHDYKDQSAGADASTCSYTPLEEFGVVNASAYRSFLLASAGREFGESEYWKAAERNLNFVLQTQQPDGSWLYAMDGARDFIDHFHTCFVMKGLAKVERLTGHAGCRRALKRGVEYYLANLFDGEGLPKPFSKAPRLTVYKRELYDCAECLNLCALLEEAFPVLGPVLEKELEDLLMVWRKPDGSFRSRKLLAGWDNVPMHRWGQSELFRSLCLIAARGAGYEPLAPFQLLAAADSNLTPPGSCQPSTCS